MILAAHLGDHILIASDRRAMSCDLKTGKMRISHDDEIKLKLWCKGAVAGTGEKVFLDRVGEYFINFNEKSSELKQMDAIYNALRNRLEDGINPSFLQNNTIIFSMFNGLETLLYSVRTQSFFQNSEDCSNGDQIPHLELIPEWEVAVTCFNIPPDVSILQNFQSKLRAKADFEDDRIFLNHYIFELKQIFAHQASIDPSVTASFDLYIQSCSTGLCIALHINNPILGMSIPHNLNYWNRF